MKTAPMLTASFFAACLFTVPLAQAQNCPMGVADPRELLLGATWTFHAEATNYGPVGQASIGTFAARIVSGQGLLTVSETVVQGAPGTVFRQANIQGRYDVYPDCSGGVLMFMLNQQAAQFQFVFQNNFSAMNLVAESLESAPYPDMDMDETLGPIAFARVTTGRAVRGAPGACPAGGNPLDGTTWSFRTESAYYVAGIHSASIGIFKPQAGGVLNISETITQVPDIYVTRLENLRGRYYLNLDCSGGILMFMANAQPIQYKFLFTNANFTDMFMLSEGLLNSHDVVRGEARLF